MNHFRADYSVAVAAGPGGGDCSAGDVQPAAIDTVMFCHFLRAGIRDNYSAIDCEDAVCVYAVIVAVSGQRAAARHRQRALSVHAVDFPGDAAYRAFSQNQRCAGREGQRRISVRAGEDDVLQLEGLAGGIPVVAVGRQSRAGRADG